MTAFVPIGCDPARVSLADSILVHGDLEAPRRHYAIRMALECDRPVDPERAITHCLEAVDAWDAIRVRLIAGELQATCIDPRAALSNGRIPIAAERWRTLEPDFTKSSAAENGVMVAIDVMISTGTRLEAMEPRAASDSDLHDIIDRLFPAEMPRIAEAEKAVRLELRTRGFKSVGNDRLRAILDLPEFKIRRKPSGRPARD